MRQVPNIHGLFFDVHVEDVKYDMVRPDTSACNNNLAWVGSGRQPMS